MANTTLTPPLLSISWGGLRLPDNEVAVYFAEAGEQFATFTSEGFDAYVIDRFVAALDTITAVADVTFSVVSDPDEAEFRMVLDTDEFNDETLDGQMEPPEEPNAGVGEFNGLAGDYSPGGTLESGGSTFLVLVHEFLHGMGLAHPHDDGGGSTLMDGVTEEFGDLGDFDLNQGVFTVMSYNDGYHSGLEGSFLDEDGLYGGTVGPSPLDIALLQQVYGENTTTGAGNSVYQMPEVNAAGTGWMAIWDTGGQDEIRYDGADNSTLDLRAATLQQEEGGGGWVSAADGIAGGFTIAYGVEIENATGGSGDDMMTGNDVANTMLGNDGADTINGGLGDDTLGGGGGDDSLLGGAGDDVLAASDGSDMVDGQAGDDNIGGGTGNDTLNGGAGNDTMGGGMDDDAMDGGDGDDIVNGGAGNDMTDGGAGNDTMGASFGQDTVDGGTGDDSLGGGTGRDTIQGGEGSDSIGGGEGDDTIEGGEGDDFVAGGGRNDLLNGGAGDDRINGGDGDDTMTGSAGADVFIYNFFKEGDADVITDFEDGVDLIQMVGVENALGSGLVGKVAALNIQDTDDGALIDYLGHTILIENVTADSLGVDDFVFLG